MSLLLLSIALQELHTLLSRRLSNSYGTAEDPEDPGLLGYGITATFLIVLFICFFTEYL